MSRRDRVKRYLAMLLAFAMIFQQAGITTIADETEAVVAQQSEAAETKVQAVPETSAPETKAPETQAPETKAPETSAPETKAPETQAPETQAPETKAPETSAPETKAPETPATEEQGISEAAPEKQASEKNETTVTETQAPETSAPETEAPETSTPETDAPETQLTEDAQTETAATEGETEAKETETETESETETEAPKTNHFAASFANGKADVTLSEAISEKAQFIAEQKSEESAYFDDALNIVGPWLDAKGLTILDAAVYDMYFEEDGKEIAVNQKANVNIQFASPILTMEPETGIQTQVYVLHIVNGNVEDAGSVTRNGAGAVTAASIHTNGFSPFVFVKVASGEPVVIPNGPIDLSNALYNAAISQVTYGGKTEAFDPNKQYPRDAKFTFELKYAFAENNKPTASGVRTAVYELPSCLSVVNATGTIECPGYAGSAGTYEIKNGVVTFVYEEAFLKAHPSDIKGTFNFEGALSNSATENKEEVEIDFNGSGTTIPITVKFEDGKVTGDKIYILNADGTIDFTIRLKVTEKDVKNLVLTDTQGSNLEFANPPEFRLDGELLNPGQYTVSGNQMTLNLGDRTRGEYTLTYKARIKDLNIKDGDHNKNRADWTWTGGSGSKDTTVQITESIVNKNGAVSNGEITWTVIYVPGNLSPAAGKTFTDTLGADQEYTGNYEVYYDSNGSQHWVGGQQIASGALSDITAADGKSFSYTFPNDQTANRGAYKLVYKTKITKDMSDIKDTVTFTNKINGDGKEADGKVEVKPGEKPKPDIVKKSVVTDSENRKATWTITVTPPEGKTVKNLVIKDELQDFYNWKGKYEGTVTIKEAGSTLTEGTDYTVAKTAGGNGVNPTMTLVFSKEISGVLEITYASDYTDSGSYSGWVGNKIHSSYTIDYEDNEEDDSASGEIKNTDFVLDKSGTLSGGIAKWEIIINDLQHWKRTDLPESTKTITDTLPEGMAYVDGSAKCMLYKENEENNPEETAITASFDPSTRKLTMTVPALTGTVRAVITYDTKITTLPTGSGNGVTVDGDRISFTNSVTVGKKTESATVTMTSKELHKVGKAVSGLKNVVEYVIDVNYEAMDLLPDSDVLVLEDVLDENLTLDTTSIKVTDRDTGEAVSFKRSFSTLNDGKTKMVLTIPDSRALRVVYRATLVTAGKEDGKTYQVSNSATLKGQKEKSTEIKTEVKYQKSDATVSGGSDSVSIQKVNEDGKSLKGATFVVRAVNPETLEDNPAYETMTATSDSNGIVTFEKLHYNTLYYYEETTAPTGYSRDTEKHYFIIKNIKDDAKKKEYEELKGKADANNISLNEFTGGNTVIFENRKETTSLMVRKEWIQEDDIPADASVQVQLFGKAKDGAETPYGDTATMNAENGWRYTWEDLPITDSNGNEITYSVKEVGESDGKVTISGNKFAVEIEDLGKEGFIIANKKLIDISGSKTWDDNNNQDGKRPSEIKIHLFADGTELADKVQTVTAANNWSWSFTDLPKYKDAGTEIEYTITEDAVENYTTVVDGYNVTNMHIPATIDINGSKTWNDAKNQDGKRPDGVTLHLYKEGEGIEKAEVTDVEPTWVKTGDEWGYSYKGLPKYEGGKELTYTITEDTVAGYTTSVRGYNVTNTHTPETIDIEGSKTWNDNNNQDGKRPGSITIRLYADGRELTDKVQTVTASNGWNWKWEDLPKYANGTEITYTITEDAVENYTTVVDGYNVTNSYTPGKVDVPVTKSWNDENNADGHRPSSIKVKLMADGVDTGKRLTLNADNHWSGSFSDLDEKKNGQTISYTVEEESVNLYTGAVTGNMKEGFVITNTHIPETTEATVKKVWKDNNNQDGKRPGELKVKLYRKTSAEAEPEFVKEVTLKESNGWSVTETGLQKYKDGIEYIYFWEEVSVADYESKSEKDPADDTITILTNTHTPEVVRVIRKVWNDADNQDGKRPAEIKVDLKKKVGNRWDAPNELVQTITLNEENGWEMEINNLPKYTDGKTNIYNWSEHTDGLPKGYYFSAIVTEGEITTLTNSYKPEETSVSVQKVWNDDGNRDGIRPESITVKLYAEAEGVAKHLVGEAVLNEANNWSATKSGLAKYARVKKDDKSYSTPYTYTWVEENVPEGYKLATGVDSADASKTILTNTHIPEKVEASVTKVWNDSNNQDGKRPTAITVKLYGKAGEAAEELILETTLNEANNWKYTKTDLLKFKNGAAYTYYWTEETQLPGYTVEAAQQNGEKSFVTKLTNTHTPEKTKATVEKRWSDNDNQDQKRPESITVILKKSVNGLIGTVDTYTLTAGADGSWKKTVDNLPKYENGTEIQYFWEESQEGLNGYQPLPSETANNMTLLINAYTPEETSVSVQKVWNDDGNRDGIRPESITVTLYAEADDVAKHKVDEAVLNETNHWAATKSGLAKNVNGKPYTYTWEEENVPDGYTLTTGYDSEDTDKTILTNTHTPETVNATVVKVWDDADNQDGKRPQDLTVTLMKNETVVVQTVTLDAVHNWTAKVENLAKNENGTPIRYSWVEGTMPEGYSLESTAVTDEKNSDDVVIGTITTLTNIYAPGKVSASVKKVWDDANNQDGIRPETLRVNLLKNGQATDQFVILSEENRWSATLDNLDEYTDGTLNEYTWSEELPNGYTVTVSDPDEVGTTTLTNTHTPATIGASVEKTWDDNKDQDGKRPEKLLVTLMRRIREQAVPISLDDADDADTNPAEEVKTVELTAAHNWKASVSNLPKYKDGQMYEYFWIEKEDNIPNGYKLTNEVTYNILSPGEGVTGFITRLTNSHKPQKINAIVKKVWDDNNNQDGKRAPELTVELMRNGTEVAGTVTLNEENNWTGTVENLDKYTGGVKNGYTWVEKNLPEGYSLTDTKKEVTEATEDTLEAAITTLTNTHTPGKVSAEILKIWDDAENQDGKRPETITAILVKNGEETDQKVTLSADNNWNAIIKDLDEYSNGTLNKYTWKEAEVPEGYELTLNKTEGISTTLTNTHTPETTDISVTKVWDDNNNKAGVRPASIQVQLYADETPQGDSVELNEENSWKYTWKDLDKYADGTEISYRVDEVGETDGYLKSVAPNEDKTEYVITNTITSVKITKVDISDAHELEGAHLQILDSNGTVVAEWDSAKKAHEVTGLKTGELYTLRETVAPDGYTITTDTTFELDEYGKLKEDKTTTKTKDGVLLVEDTATSVKVRKVDITNDKELPGAHIQIWEKTGEGEKLVTEWDSTKEDKVVEKLKTNTTYILRETVAPDGYTITTDTTFELDEHGKLKEDKTTTNTKDGVLLVEDARTVEVSKVDLGTGEELDGAHIQVLDKAGNVVDEWDSKKGETQKVKNLKVGQEYTLRETVAPNGYTLTTDTTFTIDRTGKVTGTVTINKDGVLLVEDTATKAEITKLDAATEAPLSGAVLRVIDANGTAVDEWTTDGQPHVIEAKLNTGATYQLIEVKAPDGYEIAEPISFTMKADGTTDPVVMKDAMTRSEKASVSVTKKLTFSGEEISAVDATFYVALYADEACTKRISEIMPLVFKKASSATVTFTNVEIGRTYYVGECDANGVNFVSGVMAGNVAYAAVFANGNKATVTEADGSTTVYFENQFATIPDGFYKEGILTITKKLLGSDKKAKNSNEVFYAGIFSDAAYTQLSGDVSENIVALDLAGGSEAEAEVFVAIAPGGSQTLYVTEVDANGKPVAGAAGFKYTVQVDKTSVTLSEANAEAHVTITNTETETETESETKKTTSVKTGDDTPIAPYMALMLASMAMLAAEFICRRKRRSEK
ncbi:MAG: Cna B-type domain-containing protein [Lachnospiraceae bacterium]|nr:Cna B-type domain-containing protein [Lachnospiraceae bacterium]